MSIRNAAKVFDKVDEKSARKTLKTLGKVSVVKPTSQLLKERLNKRNDLLLRKLALPKCVLYIELSVNNGVRWCFFD